MVERVLLTDEGGNALTAKEMVIVFNSRVLRNSGRMDEFDFELLSQLEHKAIGKHVALLTPFIERDIVARAKAANTVIIAQDMYLTMSSIMLRISSYLGCFSKSSSKRYSPATIIQDGLVHSGNDLSTLLYSFSPPLNDHFAGADSDLSIYFLVDPLSLAGQRSTTLIRFILEELQCSLTVLFTPHMEISEFPLSSFYRFLAVGKAAPTEESDGDGLEAAAHANAVKFINLPRKHVLTVRVDVPEPWNVQHSHSVQDTDNLRCTASKCGDPDEDAKREITRAGYTLKNLLVSGQCLQTASSDENSSKYGLPPNGLQLTLAPSHLFADHTAENSSSVAPNNGASQSSDTLVMQNLGYFQLQAYPGLYILGLAAGRASDLYNIQHANIYEGRLIPVKSFKDDIHRLIVVKKKGFEHISLLDDNEIENSETSQTGTFWKRISSSIFGGTDSNRHDNSANSANKAVSASSASNITDDDMIHVFSLATGHLYERLLRIMMLSVTKHSSKPVKFWLFENYLSPPFKKIAAAMSKIYGFQVAYVTYKWPHWLRQQTQQQRIIWGYKILFLDVLFPLNLKKVIYVDADQVVRADLKELWDLDLQGMPYGYTPFCTSRQETLGFQFWRSGYWKEHLQGKPYHISALYVVDLQKFRRYAVGDQLRSIYDQLSRDPNSLSNLDQDLPNYAQHQVPIFSLPQHWLWCESWCSDSSKSKVTFKLVFVNVCVCCSLINLDEEINTKITIFRLRTKC